MRANVKRLIDLIESEKWPQKNGRLTPGTLATVSYFVPHNSSYPRISYYGIQIDEYTYLRLDDDEAQYVAKIFTSRYEDYIKKQKDEAEFKLNNFLKNK